MTRYAHRRERRRALMVKIRIANGEFWYRQIEENPETGDRIVIFDGIAQEFAGQVARERGVSTAYCTPPIGEHGRERIIHKAEILDSRLVSIGLALVA